MNKPANNLIEKIGSKEALVCVVGLGYVGLPLAVVFAEAGFRVVGIDVDPERVRAIGEGRSYVPDVATETLAPLVSDGSRSTGLTATTSFDSVGDSDAVIVCVPTPLSKTKDPELFYIVSAVEEIARRLRPGALVVLESTTYPGTTEDVVLPMLQAGGRGYEVGVDFFLAFSPERTDPGRTDWTIVNTPKVVGGVTPRCTEAASALYQCIVKEVVQVSSPKTAEMVKLLENTYRATNIALANETAIMCDRLGIDVWEVIGGAKTKPFGFMPFYPGPGLGGHCIPVDPQYLAWKMRTLDYSARFIQLADEINLGMPLYWVNKLQDVLNENGKSLKGSEVLVLGVAYKRDVADVRESPALDIIDHLLNKGASVTYHDPFASSVETEEFNMVSLDDGDLDRGLADADCVMIVTDHSWYDWRRVRDKASLIVDTRNALGQSIVPIRGAVS